MHLRFTLSLGVVLAGVAMAATAQNIPDPSLRAPGVQPGPVVPSDSGAAAAPGYQPGQPSQHPSGSSASANTLGNLRMTAATGATSGTASTLCFEAGVGWVRVAQSAGTSEGSGMHAPTHAEVGGISGSHGLTSALARNRTPQCPSQWNGATPASSPSALRQTELSSQSSMSSEPSARGAVSTHPNPQGLTHSNLQQMSNPSSITLLPSQGATASYKMNLASSAAANLSESDLDALSARAYVSPIRLRRLMRSAPDLQTRLKLHALNRTLTKRPGKQETAPRQSKAQEMQSRLAGESPMQSTAGNRRDERRRKNKSSRTGQN